MEQEHIKEKYISEYNSRSVRIILGAFMISGACLGIYYNCNANYLTSVSLGLGISRAAFSGITTVLTLAAVIFTPVFTPLLQKRSLKKIMFICGTIASITYFCYSFCDKIWEFYICAFIIGGFIPGVHVVAISTLLNRWFRKKRGVATGIAFAGSGMYSAVLTLLTERINNEFGWWWSYRILGIIAFLSIAVAALFLISDDKPYKDKESVLPIPIPNRGILKKAVRCPAFYFLCLGTVGCMVVNTGIQGHSLAYFTDIGYSSQTASMIMAFMMFLLTITKIVLGVIIDKNSLLCSSFMLGTFIILAPLLLILCPHHISISWLFAIDFSFSFAAISVGLPIISAGVFGERAFTVIYSCISVLINGGNAVGALIAGAFYDHLGSYLCVWWSFIVVALFTTICFVIAVARKIKISF